MRPKITDAPKMDEEELPDLTPQQANFVHAILSGKSASDAYRLAYDTVGMMDKTVWAEASRLRNNRNVTAWLCASRKAGLGSAKVTLEGHLAELERLREIAIGSGNIGAAVQAEQLRGKATGHYVEKLEISRVDPTSALDEIRKLNPALADQLATEHMGAEYHGETLQ